MEVFGNDLLLTTVAIESIGITAEQSVPLQVRIDEWFKEMSALMGKHVSQVASHDPKITHFEVTPFPDEGAAALRRFQQDVASEIGGDQSARFLTLFKPDQYFCGCRQHSLDGVRHEEGRNFKEVDPETNETVRSAKGGYNSFRKRYGNFLTIK